MTRSFVAARSQFRLSCSGPQADAPEPDDVPDLSAGPLLLHSHGSRFLDTKGGPRINTSAQVLRAADGVPIPRLYGAGNCDLAGPCPRTGPAGRRSGLAITYGYIAGEHVSTLAPGLPQRTRSPPRREPARRRDRDYARNSPTPAGVD